MLESDPIFNLFQSAIAKHGFTIDCVLEDGRVRIMHDETEFKISLDNARKDYEANGNVNTLNNLVEALAGYTDKLPDWEEASATLLPIIVPADMDVGDAPVQQLTDNTLVVVVRNLPDQIVWVQADHLADWQQSAQMLFETAYQNLNSLLDHAEVRPATMNEHPYGIVLAEQSHLDSSLPIAASFKTLVESQFGWPVYVIMPARDLCIVFSEEQEGFFSQSLGNTVVEEFTTSPYPVTRELFKISDGGIEAVGHFGSAEESL
jgi:hypothetical protein